MKTYRFAVIGKDVSKSDSPAMHTFIARRLGFEIEYEKISVAEEQFAAVAEQLFARLDGFNVTIPYKLSVLPYLKRLEGDARVFGAVNTVVTGSRTGYNTDGLGFMQMLSCNGIDARGKRVLLLGAGGAGRSVAKKLLDGGAQVYLYDVRRQSAEAVAQEFAGVTALYEVENVPYYAVINATGVGMHKTEGVSPVGADLLKQCEVAVDLIYTPPKSAFLQIAENLGKKIVNGQAMLFYQAYYAACIYLGLQPHGAQAKALFEEYTGGLQ